MKKKDIILWIIVVIITIILLLLIPNSQLNGTRRGSPTGYAVGYDTNDFLNIPDVKAAVSKLNEYDYELLKTNLEIKGPIIIEDNYYIMSGNKRNAGVSDFAMLYVRQTDKKFYAVIASDNLIRIITNDTDNVDSVDKYIQGWVDTKKADFKIENVEYEFIK